VHTFPIWCRSFTAIGRGSSEIWCRKVEEITSAVKHKTARHYRSGRPNYEGIVKQRTRTPDTRRLNYCLSERRAFLYSVDLIFLYRRIKVIVCVLVALGDAANKSQLSTLFSYTYNATVHRVRCIECDPGIRILGTSACCGLVVQLEALTRANATLRLYISLTVQDRHMVTIDHL